MKTQKSNNRYVVLVNSIIDYIDNHYQEELSLDILASQACVSSFHFHRIFGQMTAVSLNRFVTLVRLDKAASLLKNNVLLTCTDVAYQCGFSSLSLFSRVFTKHYGVSPLQYQKDKKKALKTELDKIKILVDEYSKNVQRDDLSFIEICRIIIKKFTIMNFTIEERVFEPFQVAYVRHTGDYRDISSSYEQLFSWAIPNGVLNQPNFKVLTVYHDDPAIVGLDRLRQDACITITKDVNVIEPLGKTMLEGGKYIVGHFEISIAEFAQAWEMMCLYVVQHNYQLRLAKSYEFHLNNFKEHPEQKVIAELCLPIE
ncbi:MAG: AraC family transcriptional regulator [Flavobacteriaceae bacterium]|jgi:AraC family transcriptional regulator|nr:AraC family transcriptional regulator [Flavobacteriaceae bacterium]